MAATRPSQRLGPGVIQCGTCGTQTVPGVSFCFECGAPIQATESGPQVRMQADDAAPVRRGMSTTAKVLIAVSVLFLCMFGACAACVITAIKSAPGGLGGLEVNGARQYRKLVTPELAASMPPAERAFCEIITRYAKATEDAGGVTAGDSDKTRLLNERNPVLHEFLQKTPQMSGWVAVLVQNMSVPKGNQVSMQLPCEARIQAAVMESLDGGQPAAGPGTDRLRENLRHLSPREAVTFDGTLLTNPDGSFILGVLSDTGRLLAPSFAAQLTAIDKTDNGPGSAPPGK
jgi:hypothetical protein